MINSLAVSSSSGSDPRGGTPPRLDEAKISTLLQHLGEDGKRARQHGAVVPPIYQTSLYVYDELEELGLALGEEFNETTTYGRLGNPTNAVAEAKLAALEQAEVAKIFASGMAAITCALLSQCRQGSHIVCVDTVYGPTRILLESYLPKFGIETTFVVGDDPEDYVRATRDSTCVYYLESPSSLLFKCQDLAAVCRAAKERGICTIADNSCASPYWQNPIAHGVDIVVHSASKYLNGHSDVVAGALMTSEAIYQKMQREEIELLGGVMPPFPAWLLLRGLRTLPLRMKAAHEVGMRVGGLLEGHDAAAEVFHAGLDSHPQRELVVRQMSGHGSLLSFAPANQDEAAIREFARSLRYFQIGVSWGGHESLVTAIHCSPMHWSGPRWVIRLYCGLEDPDDLAADLERHLPLLV